MIDKTNQLQNEVISSQLKQLTASSHRKLEAHPLSGIILSENISPERYLLYLSAMKGVIDFYDTVVLKNIDGIIKDSLLRKKAAMITNDINYISVENRIAVVCPEYEAPALNTLSEFTGYAYVIEGSTLGGRFILNHVKKNLSIGENSGASFFNGYGENTGKMWKEFLVSLNSFPENEKMNEEIIKGANNAFDTIYNHFEKIMSYED